MLSFTRHRNADAVIIQLLKQLSIDIDSAAITAELEIHPDYPSLLAISDVLTGFHVENCAFRVEHNEVVNLPCPFIAHTKLNNGEFILVHKIVNGTAIVSNEKWNRHKLDTNQFKNIFAGVVLTAEQSTAFTNTSTFTTTLTKIKPPAIAVGLLLILISALIFHTSYFSKVNWQTLMITIVKSAGLITAILLLAQSIDRNNHLVQVLCQSNGKTDCNAILTSKAAKVFEGLTWSEVGFFYFAGTWLLVLFGGGSAFIWQTLFILNVMCLPYTIYSIYYQARIAKQWCILCCAVQAFLWLEFISFVLKSPFSAGNYRGGDDRAEALSVLLICLLTPIILWTLLKPLFLKLQQLQPLKDQIRKFKYNTELFNKLLKEQSKYPIPDEEWSIVLGNTEANNIITMVTNPYCPPCSKTHKLLEELLNQCSNMQARIVFTANNADNDINTPVSRHLMALNTQIDKTQVKQALHDWYEQKQKNFDAWANAYPIDLNEAEFDKIDKQYAWCQMAEITVTPTLMVNGHRLPDLYQLSDLKYMLE